MDNYCPIEDYGLIGNMRTAALVSKNGSLDFLCWPNFDSPSIFCRMLDAGLGGHFSIAPLEPQGSITTKQQYLPSNNVLQTTYYQQKGVMRSVDFFPRPNRTFPLHERRQGKEDPIKPWVVRRAECVRGEVDVCMTCSPAFNYALNRHTVEIVSPEGNAREQPPSRRVIFRSSTLAMELLAVLDCDGNNLEIDIKEQPGGIASEALDSSVTAEVHLEEGQQISFVLREYKADTSEHISNSLLDILQEETRRYWFNWIHQCHYEGRYQEIVHRSLLILKLLTFELTGAIIAAPTFSLPELIGGVRQWDYRYSWVRDSSFTIYIFLRMGFSEEAEAYMHFIEKRLHEIKDPGGALPIMFSIHGGTDLPEMELSHLEGYRRSAPVRVGNGASTHIQLDIYGELMDAIYLYNKYGKPIGYDSWIAVRKMIDYVCTIWRKKDMSIWEVRGEIQNFVYSKIMLWVAVDRALRLADKRCFPCPNRDIWLLTRDTIMEDVMDRGYSRDLQSFVQSYEHQEAIDSAVLIAPLVFFVAPNDPRFLSTIDRIMLPLDQGGLTSAGLVSRYNTTLSNDGVGGEEGAFSMCTFWLVEALTRAGQYDTQYLDRAVVLFENALGFGNHLGMFSEEISNCGSSLGNTPQAFSHLALVSAAFNLDRVTKMR